MENSTSGESLFDLHYDEGLKQSLRGAAVWAGTAAIVSLISSILSFAGYFIQKSKVDEMYREYESLGLKPESTGNIASAVVSLIIGLVLFGLLLKFSRKTKAGIDASEQGNIYEGLGSLSAYFRVIGIILIIVIVLMLFAVPVLISQLGT